MTDERRNGYALLLRKGGRWFPIVDDDGDLIAEFDSKDEAHEWGSDSPLYQSADAAMVIDLHGGSFFTMSTIISGVRVMMKF